MGCMGLRQGAGGLRSGGPADNTIAYNQARVKGGVVLLPPRKSSSGGGPAPFGKYKIKRKLLENIGLKKFLEVLDVIVEALQVVINILF